VILVSVDRKSIFVVLVRGQLNGIEFDRDKDLDLTVMTSIILNA